MSWGRNKSQLISVFWKSVLTRANFFLKPVSTRSSLLLKPVSTCACLPHDTSLNLRRFPHDTTSNLYQLSLKITPESSPSSLETSPNPCQEQFLEVSPDNWSSQLSFETNPNSSRDFLKLNNLDTETISSQKSWMYLAQINDFNPICWNLNPCQYSVSIGRIKNWANVLHTHTHVPSKFIHLQFKLEFHSLRARTAYMFWECSRTAFRFFAVESICRTAVWSGISYLKTKKKVITFQITSIHLFIGTPCVVTGPLCGNSTRQLYFSTDQFFSWPSYLDGWLHAMIIIIIKWAFKNCLGYQHTKTFAWNLLINN